MLIQPWDAGEEEECWSFLRQQGFGHLIAPGLERALPVVVPTQYVVPPGVAGQRPDVVLHLARPNPVWAALAESPVVLLAVAGDWAYIPSSWKAIDDEDPAMGVPTTYYAAVQLVARAEVLTNSDAVLDVLRTQLGVLEPDADHADPSVHDRLLPGIRGLRLHVEQVRGKFKYGGNVDARHRQAVAARLHERAGTGDAAAEQHLRRRLGGSHSTERVQPGHA